MVMSLTSVLGGGKGGSTAVSLWLGSLLVLGLKLVGKRYFFRLRPISGIGLGPRLIFLSKCSACLSCVHGSEARLGCSHRGIDAPSPRTTQCCKGLKGRFYLLLLGHGTSWWGRGDWLILYPGMPAGKEKEQPTTLSKQFLSPYRRQELQRIARCPSATCASLTVYGALTCPAPLRCCCPHRGDEPPAPWRGWRPTKPSTSRRTR